MSDDPEAPSLPAPPLPLPELPPPLRRWAQGEAEDAVVSEVEASSAALVVAAALVELEGPAVAVLPTQRAADDFALDLETLAPGRRVGRLPDATGADEGSPEARQLASQREEALQDARQQRPAVLVTTLGGLAQACEDPALERQSRRRVRVGEVVDLDGLKRELYDAGLQPVPLVSAPGEASFRGDILDFFPLGARQPVRLECFDEEIESIRCFDPESQRSLDTLESVELPVTGKRKLAQGRRRFEALDHFHAPPPVVIVDPVALEHRVRREHERGNTAAEGWSRVHERLDGSPNLRLHRQLAPDAVWRLGARPIEGSGGVEDLGRWAAGLPEPVRQLHLFSSTAAEGKRLSKLLRQHLPTRPRRKVLDQRGSLAAGFVLPSLGLWAANHHEVLSRTRLARTEARAAAPVRPVQEALELSPGDYVVHLTHGIGLYRGTRSHSSDAGTEDYLVLEFSEGTLLYVPASKIELLSRYIGAGGSPPRLDKIGGRSWTRKKKSVADALDEVADDLLELQARRQTKAGHAFDPDDELQAEFEASFPYADTADQVTAVEEIKRDMERPRPMDRLLCGDVGFGKTEVAVRAAFKCASQGRQVAVLGPTTLLVRQHLEVFRNRMADHALRVEGLSRFTSTKKAKEVMAGMADGGVDVVVGTHRLLSKKVAFKDLGLLIIDEEHRFGVRHKESLKLLKVDVDVLTLSATPIPRTLHMALVGLREISTLRTPPAGRQPIHTEVLLEDEGRIRQAIERELDREGQVFYLFNRVGPIEERARKVQALVPRARVAVAHGQMPAAQLDRVAAQFQNGEIDVLVCTTIVESGIDIPRVNTLIVDRSDLMGLAELHQLRGRIGRSDRKATALFMIPPKPLPASSLKRLRALEGLSHLGAGFDLAIRDLEIRGAGNLLGSKQTGHIEAVGYELYCRLLQAAVSKRRGKKPPPEPEELDISLGLQSFLPREYVRSSHQRMGMLRKLGAAKDDAALDELEAELRDRFGRLPAAAKALLGVFRLKLRCARYGIARIFHSGGSEVLLNVRDLQRFARAPLGREEARWIEGQRIVLGLPPRVVEPEAILAHLLQRLGARSAAEPEPPQEPAPALPADPPRDPGKAVRDPSPARDDAGQDGGAARPRSRSRRRRSGKRRLTQVRRPPEGGKAG